MRPWDKHPPWAHWGFFLIWVIAGSVGPILLIVELISGRAIWIGAAVCFIWMADLGVDWVVVQRLKAGDPHWSPWEPAHRLLRR